MIIKMLHGKIKFALPLYNTVLNENTNIFFTSVLTHL